MTRPGPPELWERFDSATAGLGDALSGTSPAALAAAFRELADVSGLLAAELRSTARPAPDSQMRTVVRLYLGWRLIRLLRPLLAARCSGRSPSRVPRPAAFS